MSLPLCVRHEKVRVRRPEVARGVFSVRRMSPANPRPEVCTGRRPNHLRLLLREGVRTTLPQLQRRQYATAERIQQTTDGQKSTIKK